MLEGVGMPLVYSTGGGGREQRRPMWTQHEKAVLRLLMRQYAGVTEFDPPDVHKHPIRNEMWRLLTARYNAHPHVRSRDTKQLRKAWENLKYRARKLGSEAQRGGKAQNTGSESSWPLDGVTLPGAPETLTHTPTTPPTEAGEVADWKEADEDVQKGYEEEEDTEKEVKDEVEDEVAEGQEGLEGQECVEERSAAVLNLHPLVSSLLGGSLASLATSLPFFTSPTSSLTPGLLLPQVVSSLAAADSEHVTTTIRSSMANTTVSPPPPPPPATTTSNISISTSGVSVMPNGASRAPTLSPESTLPRSPTMDRLPKIEPGRESVEGEEQLQQQVAGVQARIRQMEEQHQAKLQFLRLQMAQSAAEHEARMQVLAAQLQFWQQRMGADQGHRVHQGIHTPDHDPSLDLDDTSP
ncbi:hypothetical protein Pcinc_037215 [Petrolisthes cinctipes]|uniref:Myb/SANT-like DNA-binding domain-containing protein 3 n=1 Tax=Petrolisthes cinctipes TaxID=88211 RepID=A0AAE1BWY2_PETCI|nr:hypothetical protein Pcinc_037215 [Petrolisthes cinctipes]